MTNFEKIMSMTVEELALFLIELAPTDEFREINEAWCRYCQKNALGFLDACPLDVDGCAYSKTEIVEKWLRLQSECE